MKPEHGAKFGKHKLKAESGNVLTTDKHRSTRMKTWRNQSGNLESRERGAGSRKGKVEPQRHRGTEKAEREWAALKAPPWFGGGMVRWEAKAEMF